MRQGTEFISQEKTWREVARRIKKGRSRLPLSCQLGAERRVAQAGEEKGSSESVSLWPRQGLWQPLVFARFRVNMHIISFLNKTALFICLEATLRCSMILFILQYYLDFFTSHHQKHQWSGDPFACLLPTFSHVLIEGWWAMSPLPLPGTECVSGVHKTQICSSWNLQW